MYRKGYFNILTIITFIGLISLTGLIYRNNIKYFSIGQTFVYI